jgi:hypothetical protein
MRPIKGETVPKQDIDFLSSFFFFFLITRKPARLPAREIEDSERYKEKRAMKLEIVSMHICIKQMLLN